MKSLLTLGFHGIIFILWYMGFFIFRLVEKVYLINQQKGQLELYITRTQDFCRKASLL